MELSEKILIGKNVRDASGIIKRLRKEKRTDEMLLFVKRNSRHIMEILVFEEYIKQPRRSEYILFSISNDKEEAFLIIERLLGGFFSKNERYNADDFLTFVSSSAGSDLYEAVSVSH